MPWLLGIIMPLCEDVILALLAETRDLIFFDREQISKPNDRFRTERTFTSFDSGSSSGEHVLKSIFHLWGFI
jgi:hypothetical protein